MEASSAVSRALRLAFAFVVISCSSTLIAQVDRGNIVGSVSDPSGANVEGAKVVIRNLATDQSVEVTTDSSGDFTDKVTLPLMFVSNYTVTATDANGLTATTLFTDGNLTVHLATAGRQQPGAG